MQFTIHLAQVVQLLEKLGHKFSVKDLAEDPQEAWKNSLVKKLLTLRSWMLTLLIVQCSLVEDKLLYLHLDNLNKCNENNLTNIKVDLMHHLNHQLTDSLPEVYNFQLTINKINFTETHQEVNLLTNNNNNSKHLN